MLEQTDRKSYGPDGVVIDNLSFSTPSWHSACEFFRYLGLMPIQILFEKPHGFYKQKKVSDIDQFCTNSSSALLLGATPHDRNKELCNQTEQCDTTGNNIDMGEDLDDTRNKQQPTKVKSGTHGFLCDKKHQKKPQHCSGDTDDEELPTILPPKRRRLYAMYAGKSQPFIEDQTERLSQEFPKHNWLEQKIAQQLRVLKDYEGLSEDGGESDTMTVDFQPEPVQDVGKIIKRTRSFSLKERKKRVKKQSRNTNKDLLRVHKCKKLTVRLKCLRENLSLKERRKFDENVKNCQISAVCHDEQNVESPPEDSKKNEENGLSNKTGFLKDETLTSYNDSDKNIVMQKPINGHPCEIEVEKNVKEQGALNESCQTSSVSNEIISKERSNEGITIPSTTDEKIEGLSSDEQPCQKRGGCGELTAPEGCRKKSDGSLKDGQQVQTQKESSGVQPQIMTFSNQIGMIIQGNVVEEFSNQGNAVPSVDGSTDVRNTKNGHDYSGENVAVASDGKHAADTEKMSIKPEGKAEEDKWQGSAGLVAKKVKPSAPVQKVYPQVQSTEASNTQAIEAVATNIGASTLHNPYSSQNQQSIESVSEEKDVSEKGAITVNSCAEKVESGTQCTGASINEMNCLQPTDAGKQINTKEKHRRRKIHSIPPVPQLISFSHPNMQPPVPVETFVLGNPFETGSPEQYRTPSWREQYMGWQDNFMPQSSRPSSMLSHVSPSTSNYPALKQLQRPHSDPGSDKSMFSTSQDLPYMHPESGPCSAPPSYSQAVTFPAGVSQVSKNAKEVSSRMLTMPQGFYHAAPREELLGGKTSQYQLNSAGSVASAARNGFAGTNSTLLSFNGDMTGTGNTLASVESDIEKCQLQFKKLEEIAQTKEKEQKKLLELKLKFAQHMKKKYEERQKLLLGKGSIQAARPNYQCFNISPTSERMNKNTMRCESGQSVKKRYSQESVPHTVSPQKSAKDAHPRSANLPCPPPAHSNTEEGKHLKGPASEKWQNPPPAHCQPPVPLRALPQPEHAPTNSLAGKTVKVQGKALISSRYSHTTGHSTMDSSFYKMGFAAKSKMEAKIEQGTPVKVQRTEAHSSTSDAKGGVSVTSARANYWYNSGKQMSANHADQSRQKDYLSQNKIVDLTEDYEDGHWKSLQQERNKIAVNERYSKRYNEFDKAEIQVQEAMQVARTNRAKQEAQYFGDRYQHSFSGQMALNHAQMPRHTQTLLSSSSAYGPQQQQQQQHLLANAPQTGLAAPGAVPREPPRLVHLPITDTTYEVKQRQFQYQCHGQEEQLIASNKNSLMSGPPSIQNYVQPMQQLQKQQHWQQLQQHTSVTHATYHRENAPYPMRMEANGHHIPGTYIRCPVPRMPVGGSITNGHPISRPRAAMVKHWPRPANQQQQAMQMPFKAFMQHGKETMAGYPNKMAEQIQGARHFQLGHPLHSCSQVSPRKEGISVVPQTPTSPRNGAHFPSHGNQTSASGVSYPNRAMQAPGQFIRMNMQNAHLPEKAVDVKMQMTATGHSQSRLQDMNQEHFRAGIRRENQGHENGTHLNGYPGHQFSPGDGQQFQGRVSLGVNSNCVEMMPPTPAQPCDTTRDSLNVCAVCRREASFLCSGCKDSWYCSHECQNQAWPLHCSECKR